MRQTRLVAFGIVLVAVPLLVQLAMFVWISFTLGEFQQQFLRARESRNRINHLNDCLIKVFDFLFLIVSRRTGSTNETDTEARNKQVRTEIAQIMKETSDLLEASGNDKDPKTVAQIEKVRATMLDLASYGDEIIKRISHDATTQEERREINPAVAKIANSFASELAILIDIEKKKRSQVFDISPADRAKVRDWLTISVAVSIVSSALMAVFFAALIKMPISLISKNLKLLSENKPLMPALTRTDELGALDHLIHTVANEFNRTLARERSLIEKAADLICSLDETGTFLTVNPMAARMLSIQPSELIGTRLSELTTPVDSFAADALVRSSISSNDFQSAELTLRKSDGTTIDTRWSCLWSDQEGTLFCVAHDVTKEKELARIKQDFMNMISHDLRSPLTSVMGGLTILASGAKGELAPGLKEEAESAVRSAEKLVSFIGDLLDFQKLNAGQMPLELESNKAYELIDEAFELLAAFAKDQSVDLRYDKQLTRVSIVCDRQKVVQVIVNLLSNAIKFSPAQSAVSIEVEDQPDFVRFSVTDHGIGVPEDMRVRIFNPFEQTRATKHQGTGLGLAICKMIVEAHGGAIGVIDRTVIDTNAEKTKAETTQGSQFWFTIPKNQYLKVT